MTTLKTCREKQWTSQLLDQKENIVKKVDIMSFHISNKAYSKSSAADFLYVRLKEINERWIIEKSLHHCDKMRNFQTISNFCFSHNIFIPCFYTWFKLIISIFYVFTGSFYPFSILYSFWLISNRRIKMSNFRPFPQGFERYSTLILSLIRISNGFA